MMKKEYKRPISVDERIIIGKPDATGCGILVYLVWNFCGFVALL